MAWVSNERRRLSFIYKIYVLMVMVSMWDRDTNVFMDYFFHYKYIFWYGKET
jgi:hypothetical protein